MATPFVYSDSSAYQPPSSGPRERPTGPSPIEHEDAQAQADAIGVKARHVQGSFANRSAVQRTPQAGHPAGSPSHLSVLMGMVGSNSGLLGKAAQALAKSRAAAEGRYSADNGKIPPN